MSAPSSARQKTGRSTKSSDSKIGEHPGLRLLVQRRILDDVFQAAGEKHPGWKVLIVDEPAMKVISAAVGMYDIMERRVTIVENLDKKRAPFPDMAAIYLLDPNPHSIQKLIEDYSGDKILYGDSVFVYLLARLPDPLLDQIKTCKPLLKRIKGLVEINVDFLVKEERAFSLDMGEAFAPMYLKSRGFQTIENKLVNKLVTVCATLNEYPHIRYPQRSSFATRIANLFHKRMEDFIAQNPSWWFHGGPSKGTGSSMAAKQERGVMLLMDRADDCLTPLMHDFIYQPMVRDLLPMEGDRITYEMESADNPSQLDAKDVLLDDKDKLWVELRGKHIAAVIETLSNRIRDIMNSSSGKNLTRKSTEGNMSLSQMASALKALPEYREIMSKLSQHMHLAHKCMDAFKRENLLDLSELEQTLATGKTDEGQQPRVQDLIDQVDDFFVRMKSSRDRLRLFLITIISQGGLRSQDRRRLISSAELTRKDIRTINSLELLGLSIVNSSGAEMKKNITSMITGSSSYGSTDEEGEYAASRFVPNIKAVLEGLAFNELPLEEYPSVMPMPENALTPGSRASSKSSSRSSRKGGTADAGSARPGAAASVRKKAGGASSKWSKSSGEDGTGAAVATKFTGGRLIVFMLGGLSYSELRFARDVSQKAGKEIVIGSTDFINASNFMDDLIKLGEDEGE